MSDVSENDLISQMRELAEVEERERLTLEFESSCKDLESIPQDYRPTLKDGLKADIELQPRKWMTEGIDLLLSSTGVTQIRHFNGRSEPLNPYLVYPVFQIGTEIFLKGMWLCQFEECRLMHSNAYASKDRRDYYDRLLRELGHDLLKIIEAVRGIEKYKNDNESLRFLRIVEGIIREFYFPLYEAESSRWALSRYPKRFYNDTTKVGRSESYYRYPRHRIVKQLFENTEKHVDQLWGITAKLLERYTVSKDRTGADTQAST